MTVMRFVVAVDDPWKVSVTRAHDGAAVAPDRVMRRVSSPDGDFPFPPEPVAHGEPHEALCADATGSAAAELHRRAALRDLAPGDVERCGRWLFDALLGSASFKAILDQAHAANASLAELALRWPAKDLALSRLHWEAMRAPQGFLASRCGLPIAVTRLVAGATHAPPPIASPPRVLFALGGSIGDQELRPGAELLSVLRPLCVGTSALGGAVVAAASPLRLAAAVERVQPDVVHLIAHGTIDPATGDCLLELAADEGETQRDRNADQLLAMLARNGVLPTVVVLSACEGGVALPLARTGSLAARLVKGGIPVVVGMAGRVSTGACRVFARRFGEALLAGEPIVVATEEGRRTAFGGGPPPDRALDWALPVLFLSEGVAPDFGTRPPAPNPAQTRLVAYDLHDAPVFCGRYDVVEAFDDITSRREHPVLALWSRTRGIGRTRALKELAAEALRRGHIPVLLRWESPGASVPTSVERLAAQIGGMIARVRSVFALPPQAQPATARLLAPGATPATVRADPSLPTALADHLLYAESIDPRAYALALSHDLVALAQDARARGSGLSAASRVIALFDDVHRWDKALEPFLNELVGGFGLGTDQEPIPVVFTFALEGPTIPVLEPIALGRKLGWRKQSLERFDDGEALLAYQQVLLHPYSGVLGDFSKGRWAFDFEADRSRVAVDGFIDDFESELQGLPQNLGTRAFYVLARSAMRANFVVPADDDAILREIRKRGT